MARRQAIFDVMPCFANSVTSASPAFHLTWRSRNCWRYTKRLFFQKRRQLQGLITHQRYTTLTAKRSFLAELDFLDYHRREREHSLLRYGHLADGDPLRHVARAEYFREEQRKRLAELREAKAPASEIKQAKRVLREIEEICRLSFGHWHSSCQPTMH